VSPPRPHGPLAPGRSSPSSSNRTVRGAAREIEPERLLVDSSPEPGARVLRSAERVKLPLVNDPDKLLIHIRRDKIERRRRERGDGLGERVGRNDCCFVRVVGRMRELQALDETEDNIMEICVRRKECPHRLMEGDVRGDMVSLFACCNKLRM